MYAVCNVYNLYWCVHFKNTLNRTKECLEFFNSVESDKKGVRKFSQLTFCFCVGFHFWVRSSYKMTESGIFFFYLHTGAENFFLERGILEFWQIKKMTV